MKIRSTLTALFAVLTFNSGGALAAQESEFWAWFSANDARLFAVETGQEKIINELGSRMHRVNEDLTFEFGPVQNGKREFVISAGGIKSAFPAVEALYKVAPDLPHWVWIKYRPRRLPMNDIVLGGRTVKPDDVRYLLAQDGDKLGIVLFFEGYLPEQRNTFAQFGYLFLDEALGEFAVETQIGFIDFQPTSSTYLSQSRPLTELPAHFDEYLGKSAQ